MKHELFLGDLYGNGRFSIARYLIEVFKDATVGTAFG